MTQHKSIVLVEDQEELRKMYEMFLKRYPTYKLDVEVHSNYEFEPKEGIDAFLCDHDIQGGMSGSQWFKSHSYEIIPPRTRILMSGRTFVWQDEGIVGAIYLNKPFSVGDLYNALDKILEEIKGV